jgi:hypothetical protein
MNLTRRKCPFLTNASAFDAAQCMTGGSLKNTTGSRHLDSFQCTTRDGSRACHTLPAPTVPLFSTGGLSRPTGLSRAFAQSVPKHSVSFDVAVLIEDETTVVRLVCSSGLRNEKIRILLHFQNNK